MGSIILLVAGNIGNILPLNSPKCIVEVSCSKHQLVRVLYAAWVLLCFSPLGIYRCVSVPLNVNELWLATPICGSGCGLSLLALCSSVRSEVCTMNTSEMLLVQ